jgi:hypothetical protein
MTGPGKSLPSEEAPIPITDCGTVITQPGVYVMAADFGIISPTGVYCHEPVIDIRVSNVTIRGTGHGVDGNGAPCIVAGVGVPGGVSRIRLIDVDLRVCHGGAIVFENVSASVVEKSTIRFNEDGGIVIQGSPALSRADTIRNNYIDDNDLLINAGSDFIVSDNFVAGSGRFPDRGGVILSGAVTRSTIQRNTFTGPFAHIDVAGNRNAVVSNTLDGSSQFAIQISGQRNATIENRIHGPGDYGVLEFGAYNTFRGNTVENVGIGIEQVGGYAVIKGNTVQNNQGDGIRVLGFGTRITDNRYSITGWLRLAMRPGFTSLVTWVP